MLIQLLVTGVIGYLVISAPAAVDCGKDSAEKNTRFLVIGYYMVLIWVTQVACFCE